MNVLVDTPIWSLALRRRRTNLNPDERRLVAEWTELVREGRIILIGMIRQEVLSGIADEGFYSRVLAALRTFDDEPVSTVDNERAAANFNRCRAHGIQGSPVDLLACAVAERLDVAIFTTDGDYTHFAQHLPIRLHQVR
jgi:predicted nucleic acid-binding protein